MVPSGKSSQGYPVNAGFLQESIPGPTFFLLHINDFSNDVISNVAIYADDTTLYAMCDQASDLWQQLELASEYESELQDTVDWSTKELIDFNAGKTQLAFFNQTINSDVIDVKMERSPFEENVGTAFLFSRDSYTISIAKTAFQSLDWSLDLLYEVSLSKLLFISINLQHGLVRNTVFKCGMLFLVATCIS